MYAEATKLQKDFFASQLRSQLATLKSVLDSFESSEEVENEYLDESLKRVEFGLRQLRKNIRE